MERNQCLSDHELLLEPPVLFVMWMGLTKELLEATAILWKRSFWIKASFAHMHDRKFPLKPPAVERVTVLNIHTDTVSYYDVLTSVWQFPEQQAAVKI